MKTIQERVAELVAAAPPVTDRQREAAVGILVRNARNGARNGR